jgi:hypothetical protein
MLKILTVLKQQESTMEERTIPILLKSTGVRIILYSTVSLFNYLSWRKVSKNITMGSSHWRTHSCNGQMASSDRCYHDRARLPTTQSSNSHHDVGSPLLLGVQIIAFESSRQNRDVRRYLIGPAYQSPNVAMCMNHRHVATINSKRHAPLSRCPFKYYKCWSVVRSLSRPTNHSLPL